MYMQTYRLQRGNGVGNLFASLFRSLKPLASSLLDKTKSFLTSPTVKDSVSGVAHDLVDVGMNKLENMLTKKSTSAPKRKRNPSESKARPRKKKKTSSNSQSRSRKTRASSKRGKKKRKTFLD